MRRAFWLHFRDAARGILLAWWGERNLRFHTLAGLLVLVAGHWLALPAAEYGVLILTVALVIVTELVNTAIEAAVDLASPAANGVARKAKDVAAGAVLAAALASVGVALVIFWPRRAELLAVVTERLARPDGVTLLLLLVALGIGGSLLFRKGA